jgi:hypothetical protein
MQTLSSPAKVIDFSLLLGKIILCRKGNSKEFVSELYAIQGNELIFKTRNGKFISNPKDSITYAAEV